MLEILRSRIFLIILGCLLTASLGYSVISYASSESYNSFLSMSTLDSNMMAESYYSGNGRTINVGDPLHWNIVVFNHMGNAEYLKVKVKLLNLTEQNPDDIADTPTPVSSILEFTKILPNNSTWTIPIDWDVVDAIQNGNSTIIKKLSINGMTIDGLEAKAAGGKNFRMVFELWKYDPEQGTFVFSWKSGSETKSVWNQTWFDLKVNK